ncbi:MAG: phage portal protein [Bacteroidales bacterium]|nr:phage portal protein [Bacteroidales bacterium]
MGILNIFRPLKAKTVSDWKELGAYNSVFTVFNGDIYSSETVRSCVRPLASFSSKAEARCSDSALERILNKRPNIYMNGRAFLYKIRTRLELYNNCFIYIQRDDRGKAIGFYPVPYSTLEALEYANGLFVRFSFSNGTTEPIVLPWDDLAVVRKDYNKSDLIGDDNSAINDTITLLKTTNEGMSNAIRSTANLRGILKSTKAMLHPDDIKEAKDRFVKDYLSLENEGGIASLDSTQEFTPISMTPVVATSDQRKEIREDIFRYYNVNEDIVTCNLTGDKLEVFYEMLIEPFLVDLSTELTSKVYTGKAGAYDNYIVYEANKLQFASLEKKIQVYKEVVLYGGMTINEWRKGCNLAPLPDGDTTIMRLDAKKTNEEEIENED